MSNTAAYLALKTPKKSKDPHTRFHESDVGPNRGVVSDTSEINAKE